MNKGRPGSVAWQYFSREENSPYASCFLCGQAFRIPSSGTTTNLINHLRDKHRDIMIERHPELMPNAHLALQIHQENRALRPFEPEPPAFERFSRESPVAAEVKTEPVEEETRPPVYVRKEENRPHQGIMASTLLEQNGDSEAAPSQPAQKRFKPSRDSSVPSVKQDRSEEFRVLGSFVSSELRSAAEVDYNSAAKASLAIQEILMNLKKNMLEKNN